MSWVGGVDPLGKNNRKKTLKTLCWTHPSIHLTICPYLYPPIHPSNDSYIHPSIRLFINLLIYSLIYSFICHPSILLTASHSFSYPSNFTEMYTFNSLLTHALIHSSVHPSNYPEVCLFTHPFTYSTIHLFSHSFYFFTYLFKYPFK